VTVVLAWLWFVFVSWWLDERAGWDDGEEEK